MKTQEFLDKLEKVKKTGSDSWVACCPYHEDRNPSLTVREVEERVLVHCFAGCSVEQILSAVGMDFDALFPETIKHHVKPLRRPFPAADVLEMVVRETEFVAVCAGNIRQGVSLNEEDYKRLWISVERLNEARRLALG